MNEELKIGDTITEEYLYIGKGAVTLQVDENGVITEIAGQITRVVENDKE